MSLKNASLVFINQTHITIMEPQIEAWSQLSKNIIDLRISVMIPNAGSSSDKPSIEQLETKQAGQWKSLELHINRDPYKLFLIKIDQRIIEFKKEVETNLILLAEDISLIIYFTDIFNRLEEFDQDLKYNKGSYAWQSKSVVYDDDFLKYDFLDYFKIKIQDFYHEFMQKITSLRLSLENIEIYKKCKTINKKSISGNKKIEWKKQVNQLVDFFLRMRDQGIITEPDDNNLKVFLLNNFTWEGKPLSANSINTIMDPKKAFDKRPKENKVIDPTDYLK